MSVKEGEKYEIGNAEVQFMEDGSMFVDDPDGGTVYLCDGEPELLYERLDEKFGAERPIDELDFENSSDDSLCVCGRKNCDEPTVHEIEQFHDDHYDDYFDHQVALAMSVDVEGASVQQRDMYRDMARLYEQNFETFVNKNRDYGNSFLNTTVGPFDTEFEANVNALLVRMSDKEHRIENLVFDGNGEDHVGETAVETALDWANYAMMLAFVLQQKGEN